MASMFSNVLGYLCPNNKTPETGRPVPRDRLALTAGSGADSCQQQDDVNRENECNVVYGIEDQDDWQIVRKMSDVSSASSADDQEDCLEDGSGEALFSLDEDDTGMEEDTENRRPGGRACPSSRNNAWYLAPPACFTRSAPSPSTNPLENLLIEHPSMSVYLLPVAVSSARRAALYRSAPPLIMEEHLGRTAAGSPVRTRDPTPTATQPLLVPVTTTPHRVPHSKRKRRMRAHRHAGTLVPTAAAAVPPAPATPSARELGIRTADEEDKQVQNEEKDQQAARKLLAKSQLQRGNLLVDGTKKRAATRDGNYRCLH